MIISTLQYPVGVQSWKAAHLPTLEFRVEQGEIAPVGSELWIKGQKRYFYRKLQVFLTTEIDFTRKPAKNPGKSGENRSKNRQTPVKPHSVTGPDKIY